LVLLVHQQDWPVHVTNGYNFLNVLNGLLVVARNRRGLTRVFRDWRQDLRIFADVAYEPKRLIMQVSPSSEVYMLAYQTVAQSSSLNLAIRFRQSQGH
jgi:maltooligosyltrehalose synthase